MPIMDSTNFAVCLDQFRKNTGLSVDVSSQAPEILIEGQRFVIAEIHEAEELLMQRPLPTPDNDIIFMALDIPSTLARQLRQQDMQYIDGAGNANINRRGLRIIVSGKSRRRRVNTISGSGDTSPRFVGKAFKQAGLKLTFALLADPGLVRSSVRDMAAVAGISVGATTEALADLADQGYLYRNGSSALMHADKLARLWAELYPLNLRKKLAIGRFYGEDEWWKMVPEGAGIQFGGEIGADRLTHYLRPATGTVYVQSEEAFHALMRSGRLRKLPEGASNSNTQPVEIYNAFWTSDLHQITAPDLVVFSDLLALQDARCREAADKIYDQQIAAVLKDYS